LIGIDSNMVSIGITSSRKTFLVGFAFLAGEKTSDFQWALNIFKELGISPRVILIDSDDALFNACSAIYPQIPVLLYEWHVHKCVMANRKSAFPINEEWNTFNTKWREVTSVLG
jgi:asparagine synthetase B (glutamine-hydrolysing)